MASMMPDCHALLSALLNEVKTLSNTVTIQGRKIDAILSRLSIPASAYAADEQCRSVKCRGLGIDESLSKSSQSSQDTAPERQETNGPNFWNQNPLALRDSLDDPQSDEDTVGMDFELPLDHRYNSVPTCSLHRVISMRSAVTDSLQSLPLHLLADHKDIASQNPSTEPTSFTHRCMSAPTSPMPRASPGKSPTSFGRMLLFPTSNGCGSKESETSHNLLAKPSMIGRAFHVDSTCSHMCPLEVSTAAASRIRPPPLALHMLNLITQPAADSNHDGSSSSPAAAVSKLHSDQLTLDNSKHDNKSPPESRKLGVAAQDGQPKHSGFDSDQMGHTVGATAAKVQLHPVMEPAGCPGMVSGALTFRDMLGGPASTEGFQTQDAISPRSMDAAGGMTFRHMLCPEDKQKPGHEVALTNDDSSAHSTNTLQADTSSRKSAHCAHEVDGTALPGVKESMLAPPLTFRDMLQMSPPCMSAKHGAPTSAISSASLIPSPGVSDVSFGSSLYSPGLSCNEAEGIEPMDIRANLCNMDPPEPQAEVVTRYETQHCNSMAPHGMNVQGSAGALKNGNLCTHGAMVASFKAKFQLLKHGAAAPTARMGGSHTTSAASSQHSDSAASTPKRKFNEMRLQDAPISRCAQQAELSSRPSTAAPAEKHAILWAPPGNETAAGPGTLPQGGPKHFISPELRKSRALTDLAVPCHSDSSCERPLSAVDEQAELAQLLGSGSISSQRQITGSQSPMDTSSATESVAAGDENEVPTSGITIPDYVKRDIYGSVESVPCTDDAEPESSYESPRSLLPTPGCAPPPLSAEHLAALREGSDRVARTVEEGTHVSGMTTRSPQPPMVWPSTCCRQHWDESPCMHQNTTIAPDDFEPPCNEAVTGAEECREEDDSSRYGAASASWQSHPPSEGACTASEGTYSGTGSGCTDYSSHDEGISSCENCCPHSGAAEDGPDVIPDTPTSSEGDDRNADYELVHTGTLAARKQGTDESCDLLNDEGETRAHSGSECTWQDNLSAEVVCVEQAGKPLSAACLRGEGCHTHGERGEQSDTSASLTSDELNAWKMQHCSAPLVQATEGDSLVVLTNRLLRTAFREQRRTSRPRGTPRWKFLGEPLDTGILDTLAAPLAAAAAAIPGSNDTPQSVERFVEQTLPPLLRLSHSFAAWRYAIGKEGDDEVDGALEQEQPTSSGEGSATQASATLPSASASLCSDSLCTEDAVSCCIRRAVLNSRLFASGHNAGPLTDVRGSTVSCGRSR